jgi:tripartite-type tricarboxylate transporter receptor subunit TctC
MLHVPYKGNSQAIVDVISGQVTMMFDQVSTSVPHIHAGKLRPLAVTSLKRSPLLPEVPTIAESGLPGFRYESWNALYAPAKTPRPIVRKLNAEIARVLALAETEKRLHAIGMEPSTSTPEELDRFTAEQVAAAGDLAKKAGIRPE